MFLWGQNNFMSLGTEWRFSLQDSNSNFLNGFERAQADIFT